MNNHSSHKKSSTLERVLVKGFGKGFLVYFLPMTVLRRKFSHSVFRRSVAMGSYVAVVRFVYRDLPSLLKIWREKLQEEEQELTVQLKQCISTSEENVQVKTHPYNKKKRRLDLKRKFCEFLQEVLFQYREAVGGFLAGLATLSVDPSLLNSTLILWLMVRAARASSTVNIPGAATLGMCLSAGQILSRFLFEPQDLYPGYYRFLFRQSNRTKEQLALLGTYPADMCCAHQPQGCIQSAVTFFMTNYLESLKVYFPLYVLFLVFSGKDVNKRSISQLIQNMTRSALFLSSYCTLALTSGCWFYRLPNTTGLTKMKVFAHATVAGLATLIERPSRRSELSAYCVTYALDSIYRSLKRKYPSILKLEPISAVAGMLSSALLLHHHHLQPDLLTKWLLDISV